jgi:hypothetical protein
MTKQEWDFVMRLLEQTAKAAYELREQEAVAGQPFKPGQFVIGPGHKLVLEKELRKSLTPKRR